VESYEQPHLDDAVEAELIEFVERRARELGDTVSIRRGPIHPARREAS
jgi:trimethylamine:corrinoid methyltransferase-like protein